MLVFMLVVMRPASRLLVMRLAFGLVVIRLAFGLSLWGPHHDLLLLITHGHIVQAAFENY